MPAGGAGACRRPGFNQSRESNVGASLPLFCSLLGGSSAAVRLTHARTDARTHACAFGIPPLGFGGSRPAAIGSIQAGGARSGAGLYSRLVSIQWWACNFKPPCERLPTSPCIAFVHQTQSRAHPSHSARHLHTHARNRQGRERCGERRVGPAYEGALVGSRCAPSAWLITARSSSSRRHQAGRQDPGGGDMDAGMMILAA